MINYKKAKYMKYLKYIIIGFILYLIIGSTLPYAIKKDVKDTSKAYLDNIVYTNDTIGPDEIVLVENIDDALNARLSLIRESTETLDIVYHTLHGGGSTDSFFAEIWEAAERGVKVRIILDGKAGSMTKDIRNIMEVISSHPNVEYKKYNNINVLKPWEFHALLHDKFIIVDGEYLLLGGRNIGDRYYDPLGYSGNMADDRDVLVKTMDKEAPNTVLLEINNYMDWLWDSGECKIYKGKENLDKVEEFTNSRDRFKENNPQFFKKDLKDFDNDMVKTNKITLSYNPINNGMKEPWVAYQLIDLANKSESNILMQTPYSTANKDLIKILDNTNKRIDVVMLTNSLSSSPNFPAFSNYYANRQKFLDTGTQIYEYQSTDSIHGKSLVFDDRISAVGSFNMDDRSIYIDTETMLIIDSEEFAETLNDAIYDFIDSSAKVGIDNKYEKTEDIEILEPSSFKTVLMWIVSIFSRLFQFLI